MKILTADEMRITDKVTTDRFGISSLELMEHAGSATARFILRELPQCRRIVVLCGRGNNGGDGLVAARHLVEAGCAVSVVILGDPTAAHGEVKVNLGRLPVTPIVIEEEAGPDQYAILPLLVQLSFSRSYRRQRIRKRLFVSPCRLYAMYTQPSAPSIRFPRVR